VPVKIEHADGEYKVSTPNMVHAKHTSFQKAMSQKRLLNAVEHGWTPGRRNSTVKKMSRMKQPKGMM
jgi:hypothetical protein